MNRLMIADCFDLISVLILEQVTTTEVLNWVYTGLLIASILLGIVLKIISALRDRKVTKEELEEIKKEIDEAMIKINSHNTEGNNNV